MGEIEISAMCSVGEMWRILEENKIEDGVVLLTPDKDKGMMKIVFNI